MRFLQRGVTIADDGRAAAGYTLFAPLLQREAYLIDMAGEVVHQWRLPGQPGNYAKLQPNGNLLVSTWMGEGPEGLSAKGGLIQELDWDGNVVWEYRDPNQHHDFHRLPNGNLIYLSWELMPRAAAARVRGGGAGGFGNGASGNMSRLKTTRSCISKTAMNSAMQIRSRRWAMAASVSAAAVSTGSV